MEDELKSEQRHATVKSARKKLTGTVAQNGRVITVGDIRHLFKLTRRVSYRRLRRWPKKL